MRLATTLCVLAALSLSGCAADKSFEKEILGHPAPESSTDTGWSRTPPPPPPPPPPHQAPPPAPAYSPAPSVAAPAPVPAASPASRPPAGADYTPKPFTPAPVAPPAVEKPGAALFEQQAQQAQQPAPAPAPQTVPAATPAPQHAAASGDHSYLTFQVGEFAHAASGKQLMATLEAKGFSTSMDQGKRNNKPFYTVSAGKEGSRAMLEAELLSVGVTEPRLISERPAGSKAPAAASAPAAAPSPAAGPAPKAQPAAAPKVSAPIAPPIVEPAPPLPDGYVPPPKKNGS